MRPISALLIPSSGHRIRCPQSFYPRHNACFPRSTWPTTWKGSRRNPLLSWKGCDPLSRTDSKQFAPSSRQGLLCAFRDILPDFVSHDDINELIKQPEYRKFDISNKFISMINCIHRCLRCGAIAYEIEKNVFKCGDNTCGFKWEVLTFEE